MNQSTPKTAGPTNLRILGGILFVVGAAISARSLPAADKVDYVHEVKPILAARCFACHGALQQKSGLRLDTMESMKSGGDKGPSLEPGKSSESSLIDHVTGTGGARQMPPKSDGEPLKEREIALIRTWIDQGAIAPADEKPEPDPREHWSFRTPVRPNVPKVKNASWVKNPIDAFIAFEHEKHGLAPQPAVDKRILLRRVYLDLIGLPPTREELAAFAADSSPDAYEKVVDRLLASKQYGERWARHWMDIWRYSDWWGLGLEVRNSQKHIWHWRDWIIDSLNGDKGYDDMIREMLAADELYPNDLDKLRATGFLARNYFIFNRNTWLEETVEHTSKAFLGLTMNCSKCHDHKYDPISQQDFYRFRAFFEPYQVRTDQLPGEVDLEKDGLPRVFDCNHNAPTYLFVRGDEQNPVKDKPLSPGVPPLLAFGEMKIDPVALPAEAHTPGLRPFVLKDHLAAAERRLSVSREEASKVRKTLEEISLAGRETSTSPIESASTETLKPDRESKPIIQDDFANAHPDIWEMTTGDWKYALGKLTQLQDGNIRAALRAKSAPPDDFEARFKFVITGGQRWRSVGLSFDVADDYEVLVYLSAFAGGPKVQVAVRKGGDYVYPKDGVKYLPVKTNELQEMTIRVRGTWINVDVHGRHVLAYRLPQERKHGRLELSTFDARADFLAFELSPLPADVRLVQGDVVTPVASKKSVTVEEARAVSVLAEKALAWAELQPDLLRAQAAADQARRRHAPSAELLDLARKAAQREKIANVAKAEEDVARAELDSIHADAAKKKGGENKRTATLDALEKAKKALESPGEKYTSLKGSLKSPESNLEKEGSRGRPFPATSTGRRSALARWLTDSHNPLTARVAVNHVWTRHFGKPLVPAVFDFGRKGLPPTHPELLDWLATEFMASRGRESSDWSMKHLHRLMVTSNTYRMTSSSAGSACRDSDGDNRFYWRMNAARMGSQMLRDSLLYLAGDLELTLGGPTVDPMREEASKRRSLYFVHSNNHHEKFLSIFDDANVLECYRRAESIMPQQALALSNSKLALNAADRIASRLNEGSPSDADFVRIAFEAILASRPTDTEQVECEKALTKMTQLSRQLGNPDPVSRARANLVHALLNHNDFITVR